MKQSNIIHLSISLLCAITASNVLANHKSQIFGMILAGGSGKRLWPLSRTEKPKQFITLHHDKTLLENTIDRIEPLVSAGCTWAVTTKEHESSVIRYGSNRVNTIIAEPASRNTAPALLLAAWQVYEKNPDAILFFVPADHYIPEGNLFRTTLHQALNHAKYHDSIVLVGVQPHHPATEYGYIEYGKQLSDQAYEVNRFHEKPNKELAEKYITLDTMLWNTGIFCAKAAVFLEEFKLHAPKLYQEMESYKQGKLTYEQITEDSFDKAVLEKTKKIAVVPGGFKWSDVGNLEQFLSAKHEKNCPETIIQQGSTNNLVDVSNKLVVLLDVHDLCIIEEGNVLLIARKGTTDKVKETIGLLEKNGFSQYM